MIEVEVKLFATLREQAGWAQKRWSLDEGATVEALLTAVGAAESKLDLQGRAVYAAVNQQYAQRTTILQHGDEVALFPPVSGGRGAAQDAGAGGLLRDRARGPESEPTGEW